MWGMLLRLIFGLAGFLAVFYFSDKTPMLTFSALASVATMLRIYFVFDKDELTLPFFSGEAEGVA